MGKHTPGPWAWRGEPGNSELHGAEGCVLEHAFQEGMWLSYDADKEGRAANARLIASAPDLLDALIAADAVLQMIGGISPFDDPVEGSLGQKIRAAIAKATGQPHD